MVVAVHKARQQHRLRVLSDGGVWVARPHGIKRAHGHHFAVLMHQGSVAYDLGGMAVAYTRDYPFGANHCSCHKKSPLLM
jgi:hypothetical protein